MINLITDTGDRPYMCVLCTDTFSRSDILKRHFQKCSIRRGNPTGASHLSNPAAHLKKTQAAAHKAAAAAAAANGQQPVTSASATSTPVQPSPYNSASLPGSTMPPTSQSLPAMSTMPYANGPDIKPGLGQGGEQGSNNWSMQQHARTNQMIYSSNNAPAGGAGGHMQENDWNHFLPQNSESNYAAPMYGYSDQASEIKHEQPESNPNGYYMPANSIGADSRSIPHKFGI